jgi:mediator of RNA polymerase II transcription subunit 16, fungi type
MSNVQTLTGVAQYSAVIAGLTVTCSAAIFYHINYDDILAIARPYAQKQSEC